MKFSKNTRYKFEWWVDPTGESVKYANNGMGINALNIDKRSRDTQRVMAHAWDGNKGLWNIIENNDDDNNDKNNADGKKKKSATGTTTTTTVGIEFVSSAHGGDKQFQKYGLTILDDNLRKDRRTSREISEEGDLEEEHTSLFVSVTKNHDKKGKWIIVPAAAAVATAIKTKDDKDEDDVDDDDEESSSSSLFHIVFVSCNDGSNAKYAGYTLHLGSLRQDERDNPAQWVMAAAATAPVEGTAARLGTWRMDPPPVDVLGDWLHPIVGGVSDAKMRELKSFLQDRAGVSEPAHFVELQKEDPDCLKEFVSTQIPSLKRKKFRAALDKLVAAEAGECENNDNANNSGDDEDDDDAPLRTAYKRIKMASSLRR